MNKRNECKAWTPAPLRGCSLPRNHSGEHRYTVSLQIGTPVQFSGFGIGKMRLYAPKGIKVTR